MNELRHMGREDDKSYNSGSGSRDQDPPCRYVLGLADQRVEIWGSHVRQQFESCVERFRRPDGHNRKDNPAPFQRREGAKASYDEDAAGSDGVEPGVVL